MGLLVAMFSNLNLASCFIEIMILLLLRTVNALVALLVIYEQNLVPGGYDE